MSAVDARQPPSNVDAEQSLLGACMMSARALEDATGSLGPDDFYRPSHEELFTAMIAMRDAGKEVNPVSLAHHIGNRLVAIGGAPYLHELFSSVATSSNVGYYAEIITDMADRRRLLMAGQRAMQLAYADAEEPGEVIDRARSMFDDLASTSRRAAGDVEEIGSASKTVLEALAAGAPTMLPTGWREIDDMHNGGLRPGTLTVIGARPSIGKSLIAGQLALDAALHGRGALFISLEMTKFELICRMLSNLASIPLGRLMAHKLGAYDGPDWQRVQRAHDRLDSIPLGLTENPSLGITAIKSLARDRVRTARGLSVVIVDYLGLIKPASVKEDRRIQVDALSRGLKLMAKELEVPVVAAHQLNRGSEQRADKRPVLSDLRESGAIEQDADNVWLLHREAEDPMDPTKGNEIEVHIAKNRQGRTGSVMLDWVPEFSRAVSATKGF